MDPVTLRSGTSADASAMGALWDEATRVRRAGLDLSEPEALDAAQTLALPETFSIIAEAGGTLIGMAIGLPARDDEGRGSPIPGLCHISMVAVSPDWWGRGVGRRIITALLDAIRERGYTEAQLWTQQSNTRARRLYDAFGFTPSGREKLDNAGEPILHFHRRL